MFKKNHTFVRFGLVEQIIFTDTAFAVWLTPQIMPDVFEAHPAFFMGIIN